MRFDNRDTEIFMYLVSTFVADKQTYLLPTNEFYKTDPTKTLLGYFDDEIHLPDTGRDNWNVRGLPDQDRKAPVSISSLYSTLCSGLTLSKSAG